MRRQCLGMTQRSKRVEIIHIYTCFFCLSGGYGKRRIDLGKLLEKHSFDDRDGFVQRVYKHCSLPTTQIPGAKRPIYANIKVKSPCSTIVAILTLIHWVWFSV